jgi:endonuclease YncB( thermonuclease family)
MLRLLAALILLVIATTASAQTARVVDGDTLELKTGERIRVWGIDAPEGSQVCQRGGRPWQCGDDAAAALEALVDGRELTCTEVDRDRYGRTVATCTVAGRDIGATMVRQGWALDFERYSTGCMLPSSSRLSRHSEGCGRVRSFRRGSGAFRGDRASRGGSASDAACEASVRHQPRL